MPALRHDDDIYETPPWLFDDIVKKTGLKFDLDICADENNTKCKAFITEEQNILEYSENDFKLNKYGVIWCNPPRSKNGKFVNFVYDVLWKGCNLDVCMLLCWNDLGNKYGEKLFSHILNGEIVVENLGKIRFYKDDKESKHPSRLCYFWAWFKNK